MSLGSPFRMDGDALGTALLVFGSGGKLLAADAAGGDQLCSALSTGLESLRTALGAGLSIAILVISAPARIWQKCLAADATHPRHRQLGLVDAGCELAKRHTLLERFGIVPVRCVGRIDASHQAMRYGNEVFRRAVERVLVRTDDVVSIGNRAVHLAVDDVMLELPVVF